MTTEEKLIELNRAGDRVMARWRLNNNMNQFGLVGRR